MCLGTCRKIGRALFITSVILMAGWSVGIEASWASEPTGYTMAVASLRTGDTEIFLVDPETGDAQPDP